MTRLFRAVMIGHLLIFAAMVTAIVVSDVLFLNPANLKAQLFSAETLFAIRLSVLTATFTTVIAMVVGVPAAYALSRYRVPFASLIDTLVDLPIVLPPLVVGFSLLVFYQTALGDVLVAQGLDLRYTVPGIILAQFLVAAAFAIRTVKATFDSIDPRLEAVARTLGASPARAFRRITLPLARRAHKGS